MSDTITHAARDVITERVRQQHVEGYTAAHDARHTVCELAAAAAAYAIAATLDCRLRTLMPKVWPWPPVEFRILRRGGTVRSSRRRMLVKAGALVLAAIDRLDAEVGSPADTEDASSAVVPFQTSGGPEARTSAA